MKDRTTLFCHVSDFWKTFEQEWNSHLLANQKKKRGLESELCTSEMRTTLSFFSSIQLQNILSISIALF